MRDATDRCIIWSMKNARKLIDKLGGPIAVAKLLKLRGKRPDARVRNWYSRGIPAAVMLKHREVLK